jgi:hypothetical protein
MNTLHELNKNFIPQKDACQKINAGIGLEYEMMFYFELTAIGGFTRKSQTDA